LGARGGADRVGGFEDEQRLVAEQHVERGERTFEVGGKLVRAQAHRRTEASRRIRCWMMSRSMSSNSSASSRLFVSPKQSERSSSRRARSRLAGRISLPALSSRR